ENHDLTTFEKYVDIDGVTSNLLDQFMATQNENEMTKGFVDLMKPQLSAMLKGEISKLIEQGNGESIGDSTNKKPMSIIGLWEKTGKKNGKISVDEIVKDAKIATVRFEIEQTRFDTTLYFNLKMRDKGGYWQLAELTDFNKFNEEVESLEQNRVDKLNKPIKNKIKETIDVKSEAYKVHDKWGGNDKVTIDLEVVNIGKEPIADYLLALII